MQTLPLKMRFSGAPTRLPFAARTITGSTLSAPASRGPVSLRGGLVLNGWRSRTLCDYARGPSPGWFAAQRRRGESAFLAARVLP